MADSEAGRWSALVADYAGKHQLRYEPTGSINPKDGPVALCPGGSNRIVGELAADAWGAACDAEEVAVGRFGRFFAKEVVPKSILVKSHAPDLARVVPNFNIESIEATPDEQIRQRLSRRVEMESIEFNRRFCTTVPSDHDPVALRELFSPSFLDWVTRIDRQCDIGCSDRQLWFLWRMRRRDQEELGLALAAAGGLIKRVHAEIAEELTTLAPPGPWGAGLSPFPGTPV